MPITAEVERLCTAFGHLLKQAFDLPEEEVDALARAVEELGRRGFSTAEKPLRPNARPLAWRKFALRLEPLPDQAPN